MILARARLVEEKAILAGGHLGSPVASLLKCELRWLRVSARLAMMNDVTNWKVPKWPFFLADALLFGFAYYFVLHAPHSIHYWEIAAACVVFGAVLSLIPFYLDYRAMAKALEINALGAVTEKIQKLDTISAQINAVTNRWETIQETLQAEAEKTSTAAKQIADQMAAEGRQFTESMQKMNDNEKVALRLEVEKLHRGETEWLQVLVRILDHVFALHTAAIRTGDPKFAEPITNFQNACRDIAHRIGLTPFVAEPDEPFNAERHQVAAANSTPPENAVVAETVGTGFTFQGQFLRAAIVRLREVKAVVAKPMPAMKSNPAGKSDVENAEAELPL
jgi:molecular chaperone GrpE (heat shock protein)